MSADFSAVVAEIGVLLLLFTLGLEYTSDELRHGLRTGVAPGLVDAAANFFPGMAVGLLLGWEVPAAVLLDGVSWVSSSGIVAKVLSDLDQVGNRETVLGSAGKVLSGWVAAGRAGVGTAGRLRAGGTLIARGEFSVVIASLGEALADGPALGAVTAAFVLLTAVAGPLIARWLPRPQADRPAQTPQGGR